MDAETELDGLTDSDGLIDADAELDGLIDAETELDGLIPGFSRFEMDRRRMILITSLHRPAPIRWCPASASRFRRIATPHRSRDCEL